MEEGGWDRYVSSSLKISTDIMPLRYTFTRYITNERTLDTHNAPLH